MSLIDKLGAEKEAAAFYNTVNKTVTPQERNVIVRAGEVLAWAITWRVLLKLGVPLGVLVAIGLTILGSQATGEAPPGVVAGDEIKVIAREPGVAFDVLLFCNDPTTSVGKTPMTDAPAGGNRYIALRGTESVNWPDSPEGKNPTATHYVTAPDGNQRGEAVEVTKAAADCMKRRAK